MQVREWLFHNVFFSVYDIDAFFNTVKTLSFFSDENTIEVVDVDGFIDSRSELAEREYEERRRDGLTVDQAQERAITVLMEGVE